LLKNQPISSLMKNDLKVITDGVIEGRKTFGNTIKIYPDGNQFQFREYVQRGRGIHIFVPFLPMIPIQLY